MSIETTTDPRQWNEWCDEVDLDDVYYDLEYLNIWEDEERGEAVGLRYTDDHGTVLYPVMRVPLDPLEGGEGHVDVRTAYDFGGPLTFANDGEASESVFARFDEAYRNLLEDWQAVTEFARLHPLRMEVTPEDAEFHAENLVVDFSEGYEGVHDNYKSSFARNVRKAERNGLTVDIESKPSEEEIAAFVRLYTETMEKVDARDFYFFSEETLRELIALPEMSVVSTWHEGDVIASAIVLQSANDLFYYLGASKRSALDLRPNNILFDSIIKHAADADFSFLHLGGGSPGLRRFKSQMATGSVDYHLLKRTYRPEKYRELCEAVGVDEDDGFPAYRSQLLEGSS